MVILAHLIKYPPLTVPDMPQLANGGPHPSEADTGGEEFTNKCNLLFISELRTNVFQKAFGNTKCDGVNVGYWEKLLKQIERLSDSGHSESEWEGWSFSTTGSDTMSWC